MALDKGKEFPLKDVKNQPSQHSDSFKSKMKRDKTFQTKVVVRRLPPTMTEEQFLNQISPIPDHDYMYFVKADMRLAPNAFSRAYINFLHPEDIFIFKEKFDGYVFLDAKGNEYPAVVEFAPFQKIPKKRSKKRDAKSGTIANDPDYLKFLESLKNPDEVTLPSAEVYLEEIETREKELKANNGVPKMTTPLIEYLKARKIEQQKIREEKREERKRKELEKKRIREEERRRRKAEKEHIKEKVKEKESPSEKETAEDVEESLPAETPKAANAKTPEPVMQVLKNPEREKDQKEQTHTSTSEKSKEYLIFSRANKDKERPVRKEWERVRPKERPKASERMTYNRDKDRSRRDRNDKLYSKRSEDDTTHSNKKDVEEKKQTEESAITNSQKETAEKTKETEKDSTEKSSANLNTQWSPKDKRDNSCPGNVENSGSRNNSHEKSKTDDSAEANNASKSDSNCTDDHQQNKDPRAERRIRNKDRPSLEIYRPGMRRFSAQRSSPQKEISTSASNSSSPSPTPPLAIGAVNPHSKDSEKAKKPTA